MIGKHHAAAMRQVPTSTNFASRQPSLHPDGSHPTRSAGDAASGLDSSPPAPGRSSAVKTPLGFGLAFGLAPAKLDSGI